MIRLILMLILVWTNISHAKNKDCEWENDTPCLTIYPKYQNNSNALGDKITPTSIITKSQIQKYNLIDVPKVLNYVQGLDITQSGPTGQQSSVFMRGTNSNHTLVMLNGIPINDWSTPTGAYDAGQDFMSNVQQVNVYKGTAGAHWGADAIGGAINIITYVDYDNKISMHGSSDVSNVNGNIYKRVNDWDVSLSLGQHDSETVSALAGASEKDGVENKSLSLNASKWYDNLHVKTSLFTRNTLADIDGHSLSIQNDKWADNTFYAFQAGVDYEQRGAITSLTLHTHEYDRDYDDAHYDSQNHTMRLVHQRNSWGIGFDYKHNESYGKDTWSKTTGYHHNLGYFFNFSHNIFSYHHRFDEEHESYKIGFLQPLNDSLTLRGNHATGYKNKTTWGALEFSDSQEISLDYNNFTTTLFKTDVGRLNTDGIEMSYGIDNFRIFASHLNSKTGDVVSLRRPNWNLGLMHSMDLDNKWSMTTNYKFKAEHLDVHNSNWSTISMPDTHLLDLTFSRSLYGIDLGFTVTNVLDEDYESPHGFSQDGRRISLGFNRSF